MKALTLRQPWAALVARGAKRIETRSWKTAYRGPLAIHASTSMTVAEKRLLHREPFAREMGNCSLPLGTVIAIVELVEVEEITADNVPDEPERSFGDYTPGRYAWRLTNVRQLTRPIPAKGALGLWEWDAPDTIEERNRDEIV